MKSTKVAKENQLKYPCLMESVITGAVVLFIDKTEGMQVTRREVPEDGNLGHYSMSWGDSHDSKFWKPFNGKIVLEND